MGYCKDSYSLCQLSISKMLMSQNVNIPKGYLSLILIVSVKLQQVWFTHDTLVSVNFINLS